MRAGLILAACGVLMAVLAAPAQDRGTFKDPRDGRVYRTVTLGAQTWMAENLAFKVKGGCHAYGRDAGSKKANVAKYGYLYEWTAALNACPPGWHLPTKQEWETLIAYLGGEHAAGAAMKSQIGWGTDDPAEDRFGFSALPGGYLTDKNKTSFSDLGQQAIWWMATEYDPYTAWTMHVWVGGQGIDSGIYGKFAGGAFSVRCVKD